MNSEPLQQIPIPPPQPVENSQVVAQKVMVNPIPQVVQETTQTINPVPEIKTN